MVSHSTQGFYSTPEEAAEVWDMVAICRNANCMSRRKQLHTNFPLDCYNVQQLSKLTTQELVDAIAVQRHINNIQHYTGYALADPTGGILAAMRVRGSHPMPWRAASCVEKSDEEAKGAQPRHLPQAALMAARLSLDLGMPQAASMAARLSLDLGMPQAASMASVQLSLDSGLAAATHNPALFQD